MDHIDDLDSLLAQLKARVEKRRQAGEYPPELEDDLSRHFRRIAAHRGRPTSHVDKARLVELAKAADFNRSKIPIGSSVPGGRLIHMMMATLTRRQVQGVLDQISEFSAVVRALMNEIAKSLEELTAYARPDLAGQVELAFDQIALLEAELHRSPNRASLNSISYKKFQDEFRGSHEELAVRYRDMALTFDSGPVLDLGCGTGPLLDALRDRNIAAIGIDSDPEMVAAAVALGLEAREGDLLDELGETESASLGGIAAIQVLEHLAPAEIVELVVLAAEKLRPSGKLLIETLNPQSLMVHAGSLYLDPTHVRPVHPGFLEFVIREAGFMKSELEWGSLPLEDSFGGKAPEDEASTTPLKKLTELVFGPQDYLIIATR